MSDTTLESQASIVRGPGGGPIVIGPPRQGLPSDGDPPLLPLGPRGGLPGFTAHPGELRAVGDRAGEIADDLARAVGGHAGALADVGPHTGWAVGGAVSRCAEAWEDELKKAVEKVRAVAEKLAATAAHYSTVDESCRVRMSELFNGGAR
ncbi:type VII secretion target [Actinocrispum sp. NPDC049592]|uniref:type VII secretion target n=1 Tax=Actinocrispum sp. NPDC049592 TaxID=3154835 RepID=UPI0034362AEA